MYKIAIAGASTLLGRELKDALSESPLASANVTLFDDQEGQGQLDQVGDEITFIQNIGPDAFEQVDFTFFCGTEEMTRRQRRPLGDIMCGWRQGGLAVATVAPRQWVEATASPP